MWHSNFLLGSRLRSLYSFLANSSCTHILITKNLSASKTQKFLDSASSIRGGKRKVVHVDCE